MLKHIGYEDIAVAPDGAAAVKLYQEAMKAGKPFDVVILDLTIPGGMGGKETIKKLLEIDSEVKALVSSGYSSELDITEYKEYGFKGAVGKPYTIDQMRQALHELLS
jgi:two-component system, cell cycle sensor histidine kinase and response regulator CckA